ncbi:hypothetical protein KO500_14935 [Cellulophaga baltica]|uniref:hypothetical protein n=1 Tax=Cellulophaga TaxID=104264 RepID=UPI001C06BA84|nr:MULTISPECIES: hypothetical protein [Cellulophaga]MBU2997743.1 hypothetical protein [Cellulophaga baltica]MDO6769139.1 hypothetical protein [Cellulophaga sp. 1_MG-2023]
MKKLLVLFLCITGLLSCKEGKTTEEKVEEASVLLDLKKIPKKVEPSAAAIEAFTDWPEFNALQRSFEGIYDCETDDDLTIIVEDLIEKEKLLIESDYPEIFDREDIKSRQKVFRTYVLKIKMNKTFNINPREAVIEMVNAFNAYNNQFSIVMTSKLDTKILFDE